MEFFFLTQNNRTEIIILILLVLILISVWGYDSYTWIQRLHAVFGGRSRTLVADTSPALIPLDSVDV
jgi:hypothetical protein